MCADTDYFSINFFVTLLSTKEEWAQIQEEHLWEKRSLEKALSWERKCGYKHKRNANRRTEKHELGFVMRGKCDH